MNATRAQLLNQLIDAGHVYTASEMSQFYYFELEPKLKLHCDIAIEDNERIVFHRGEPYPEEVYNV